MAEGEAPKLKKTPEQFRELTQPLWNEQTTQARQSIELVHTQTDSLLLSQIDERILATVQASFQQEPNTPLREEIDPVSLRQAMFDSLTTFIPEDVPNDVFLRNSSKGPILVKKPYIYRRFLLPYEINVALYHYGFIDGKQKSIIDVAKQFGITKQRVSQIDTDVKKTIRSLPALRELVVNK